MSMQHCIVPGHCFIINMHIFKVVALKCHFINYCRLIQFPTSYCLLLYIIDDIIRGNYSYLFSLKEQIDMLTFV